MIIILSFVLHFIADYQVDNLKKISKADEDDYVLTARGDGKWPEDGFSIVLDNPPTAEEYKEGGSYYISVDIKVEQAKEGRAGVMYNAKDMENFDFAFFRYERFF